MEFILADQDRMELGILSAAASLDIDLSRMLKTQREPMMDDDSNG